MEAVFWIDKMISSPYKEVRIASLKAAEALGDIGDNEYINKILSLEFDQEWEVRAFLAKFLKKVKTDNSVEGLKRLMKDMNWFVRYNAANSLAEQGEKGIKALIDLLNSEDKFARDKAKEMIQKEIVFHKLFNDLEGPLKNKILSQIKLDGIEGGITSGI